MRACPKCGFESNAKRQCPKCLTVFEAFEAQQAAIAAEAEAAAHREAERLSAIEASKAAAARAAEQREMARGWVCKACGHKGSPKKVARGMFIIEVSLWFFGLATLIFGIGVVILIIALIYSLWRMGRRQTVCASCRSAEVIPAASPMGRQLVAQLRAANGRPHGDG